MSAFRAKPLIWTAVHKPSFTYCVLSFILFLDFLAHVFISHWVENSAKEMSRVCKDCPFFFFFSCFLTCMKGNHLKPTFHSPCSSNQKGVGLAFLRYTIALGYQNGLFIAFHVFFALVFASCKVIILIGCYIISEICTVFPKIQPNQPNTFCLGLLSKKKCVSCKAIISLYEAPSTVRGI